MTEQNDTRKTFTVRYRYAMEHMMEIKAESREEAERIAKTEFDCQDLSNDSFLELEDIDTWENGK